MYVAVPRGDAGTLRTLVPGALPAVKVSMGRLLLGLFAQRFLRPHYICHTVTVIRVKALLGSRHSLVARGHKLTGILLPIVQKAFLFITSKRCVANQVTGRLIYCRGIKYRRWIVDLRHIFGVSTAKEPRQQAHESLRFLI